MCFILFFCILKYYVNKMKKKISIIKVVSLLLFDNLSNIYFENKILIF